MIKALPSMEHVFTVQIKGTDTGQVFDGSFTYKRPNIRKNSDIDKTAAFLDGGIQGLDDDTKLLHRILAVLKHTLIKYPKWWTDSDFGYELYDSNVILEIYQECMKFENDWKDKVYGEIEKSEAKAEEKAQEAKEA